MPPPTKVGRPTELTQVARHRPDGTPVTVAEQIVDRARLGMDYQACADAAGVSRSSLHAWKAAGGRLRAKEARGKAALTPDEAYLRDFVDSLERAEAEWEANRLSIIQAAAEGGATMTKVTEKYRPGEGPDDPPVLIERTVIRETLRPEWQAAAWQLERRKPAKYGRRFYTEVTGADGTPLVPQEEQARNLADELRAFQLGADSAKK